MKTTLELPAMYADHHVLEVRRILLDMDGVKDVYASSSFRIVEIEHNSKKTTKAALTSALEDAGYGGELSLPQETDIPVGPGKKKDFFRHSASSAHTRNVMSFEQEVGYEGRAQWPCPGMGVLDVAVTQTKEANNG